MIHNLGPEVRFGPKVCFCAANSMVADWPFAEIFGTGMGMMFTRFRRKERMLITRKIRQRVPATRQRRVFFETLEERSLLAVGDLRFVTYNVHAIGNSFGRGSGLPSADLGTVLQAIGNEVTNGLAKPVDLLALQEVRSQATTSADVVSQLNAIYGAGIYARGSLNGNPTSDTVGLVYNTQSLDLLGEVAIGTASTSGQPRQTLRYQLRPDGASAASEFYVYVSHFKAGDTSEDKARRQVEAAAIRADADALGSANVLYVGDFNMQSSSETAYQTLLAAGNGQAFDPINRPGNWNNNNSFKDIVTQAPQLTPPPQFTGGGLDDRFDFQLISGELTNGTGLEYLANSYHTFGINGSLNINSNVNDAGNTALPGLANRTTILNLLATVSDHLPVVANFNSGLATTTVQFTTASQTVSEATTTFTVTAQLSGTTTTNVSVPFTLSGTATGSGSDYTLNTPSPLSITAGSLTGSITFTVHNDALDEANETVVVTMGTPTNAAAGATTVHTITIQDDDPAPTVQWTTSSQIINESVGSITLTAQLSAISGQAVTVPFSLGGTAVGGGTDYTLVTSSPLTIPAGLLSNTVTININDDVLDEAAETIIATLGAPTNATLGSTTSHTASILDNDLLRVMAITATATGFQATLNGPVNVAALNLYDQNSIYGAADVTLIGATTGAVRGSLVMNAAGDQVTFLKTGGYDLASNSFGTLVPDTYTVTLRSGSTGFVGMQGDQLDGDANGLSGDNYSASFVVAAPAANSLTLSLPDFARGYGQPVNLPANLSTGIPLTISRGADVTSVAFTLQYDPALLTITGVTTGSGVAADAVLNVNNSVPGQLVVSLTSANQLSFFNAPFTLLNIAANVPATAPYTEKHSLTIASAAASATSGPVPVVADNGLHIAAFFGDVDAGRSYNSTDLTAVQRVLTGGDTGYAPFRTADPAIMADLSADGSLQSDDASLIFRLINAVPVPAVPALPSGVVTPPPTGADPRIFVPRELSARAGQIVAVPVMLTATDPNPITLSAADISIQFDPTALSLLGLRGGSLLQSHSLGYGPAQYGELELHAWSSAGQVELTQGQSGSLVVLEFLVSETAHDVLTINLIPGSRARTAAYDASLVSLVLDPEPTLSSEDEIDGLITILAAEQSLLQSSRRSTAPRTIGPWPVGR